MHTVTTESHEESINLNISLFICWVLSFYELIMWINIQMEFLQGPVDVSEI